MDGTHLTRLLPIPVGLLVHPCTRQCRRFPLTPSTYPPPPPPHSSRTEEPAKAGTRARDRRDPTFDVPKTGLEPTECNRMLKTDHSRPKVLAQTYRVYGHMLNIPSYDL